LYLAEDYVSGGDDGCDVLDDDDDSEDGDTFDAEFSAHKRDYYMTKLEYDNVTP
jgi:hypothetical protein